MGSIYKLYYGSTEDFLKVNTIHFIAQISDPEAIISQIHGIHNHAVYNVFITPLEVEKMFFYDLLTCSNNIDYAFYKFLANAKGGGFHSLVREHH